MEHGVDIGLQDSMQEEDILEDSSVSSREESAINLFEDDTIESSGSRRRRPCQTAIMDCFFDRMQEMQNSFIQQFQQSLERLERLVNNTMDSNACMVTALVEGIRSLRPPVPQPPTYTGYEYPGPGPSSQHVYHHLAVVRHAPT
ncbi:Hypothetical protein SMAX5B_016917 [Scophthalmus maximus]|uniref:Uncharacterized protein n=1 Tax=Scophthalmus maximus TaxID=52904 RepID=A0A2U9CL05_SCOMX|nr:Hypothetical protein SMAX5B_016917 [Scophthalmus maximus]